MCLCDRVAALVQRKKASLLYSPANMSTCTSVSDRIENATESSNPTDLLSSESVSDIDKGPASGTEEEPVGETNVASQEDSNEPQQDEKDRLSCRWDCGYCSRREQDNPSHSEESYPGDLEEYGYSDPGGCEFCGDTEASCCCGMTGPELADHFGFEYAGSGYDAEC